jgi:hypothetical protein
MKMIDKRNIGGIGFGKKGLVGGALITFMSVIFIIVVMLVFSFLFYFVEEGWEFEGETQAMVLDANMFISNYVRAPTYVDGEKVSIAYLINLAAKNESYKEQLEYETATLLRVFAVESCKDWSLSLDSGDEDFSFSRIMFSDGCKSDVAVIAEPAQLIVPLDTPDEYVIINIEEFNQEIPVYAQPGGKI